MKIKKDSKRGRQLVFNYKAAVARKQFHLENCYTNPSQRKRNIDFDLRSEMVENGGYGFVITSFNTQIFTCAYRLGNDLVYHTPTYRYVVEDAFI